jgi:hypothetical protein
MPLPSRRDDIWGVYQKYGGDLSLRRLTIYCLEEGIWSEEEQHNLIFSAAQRECQRVLNRKDHAGLPLAGPTPRFEHGDRRWRQIGLWDYADAEYNLGMRLKQVLVDYKAVVTLHNYIQDRYGTAPEIPHWEMNDPDAPLWWEDLDDDEEDEA